MKIQFWIFALALVLLAQAQVEEVTEKGDDYFSISEADSEGDGVTVRITGDMLIAGPFCRIKFFSPLVCFLICVFKYRTKGGSCSGRTLCICWD